MESILVEVGSMTALSAMVKTSTRRSCIRVPGSEREIAEVYSTQFRPGCDWGHNLDFAHELGFRAFTDLLVQEPGTCFRCWKWTGVVPSKHAITVTRYETIHPVSQSARDHAEQ